LEDETVPDKKAARQDMNFFQRTWNRIRQWFRETVGELRKVSWPTRKEALNLTWIVLIVIGVMTIYLGVILDTLYAWFFRTLFGA
jgi:preprotein translocase subunit SecE